VRKNQEPGTRNQEPGTRNQEPGTRNQEPGTRNQEPGTRNQVATVVHVQVATVVHVQVATVVHVQVTHSLTHLLTTRTCATRCLGMLILSPKLPVVNFDKTPKPGGGTWGLM